MHTLIKINHDSPLRFGKEILQSGLAFNIYDIQLTVDACMLLEDAHLLHIFFIGNVTLTFGANFYDDLVHEENIHRILYYCSNLN
jgi:hypothetical protein